MRKLTWNTTTFFRIALIVYIIIYGLVSFSFLEIFPLVHSDESWLAGLSRAMAKHGDFSVTEPFFDAWDRYPHAIKILFHGLQVFFFSFAEYSVGTVRLLSLIMGLWVLLLFFFTLEKICKVSWVAFFFTVIFSFDIQFIYASHFGRQEIYLLLLFVAAIYILFASRILSTKKAILLGVLTGIGIMLHPNSFILACMIGCCFLASMVYNHCKDFKPLAIYVGVTGFFASVVVAISYSFRANFLSNYFSYGADIFDIDTPVGNRFSALISFFQRLFSRQGGTYYVADIRLQFILFLAVAIILALFFLAMRKEEPDVCRHILKLLCSCVGIIVGIFIIGRYSQLSILFLFPLGWIMVALFLSLFEEPIKKGLTALICAAVLLISIKEIRPFMSYDSYDHYLEQISAYVDPSDKVLGNLNMDFYFNSESLMDYRNLPYVMAEEGTLYKYVESHEFAYIFYTDELTYYFEHRPYYNTIYGNIMFAEDLLKYCKEECEYVGSFKNAYYSPRILELIGQEEYGNVYIYRTKYASSHP